MNQFGRIFRITIFGESHGTFVGVCIDGCPAGIELNEKSFLKDLQRRKSGTKGTTARIESDNPKIISGVFKNKTTGSPITILFENNNTITKDYSQFKEIPRPGHTDFVSHKKFKGYADYRGSGSFSGRLTLGIVASGVIAKKIITPVSIQSQLIEVKGNKNIDVEIEKAIQNKTSIGGIIECKTNHIPIGLGDPFFDSLESQISHIIFSIPAIKGIEFGNGFASTLISGDENNDSIISKDGKTKTNHCGGINGGISNGNEIVFNVAVKPTSSISKTQTTFNFKTQQIEDLKITGRHDICIALHVPVIIEAATAIVIADNLLLEQKVKKVF